jgi:peptide/nickel transport system substrate-binding protein
MSRIGRAVSAALLAGGCAVALAACGGGGGKTTTAGKIPGPVSGQKKGGTLKVLTAEAWEHLDPGASYFQLDYLVEYATQRPLYSYKPTDFTKPVPDLADGDPQVSADQKTVTVKIKPNVKFSPPVNRAVTSKDVKYAIERGFNPTVANGYEATYFANPAVGGIVGADKAKGGPISGIETPDDQTVVFKLTKPFGKTFVRALVMPVTAPVPEDYVTKNGFDKKTPAVYDSDPTKQAFSGPYMISQYAAGKHLTLIRNPNWDPSTDYRPAYADRIDWTAGADPNVAGRQVLTGRDLVMADSPSASILKLATQRYHDQITFVALGNRYVGLNTAIAPFNNINLRKAVSAAMDRVALQKTRGGPLAGDIATHILAPTGPGFGAAGGMKGTGLDFLAHPNGDPTLAARYMKKAGYPSGKYTGPAISMVGDNSDPASKTAQVVLATFQKLGFKVNFRSVSHDTMYSKFCNVPKQKVQVCPNVGWLPDFADGFAWLWATFNSDAIVPVNNSNWPQLRNPQIDSAMVAAEAETDPAKRADDWGKVDRMITATASVVPWFWDKQPNIESKDVQGVIAQWNADWDLSFTSLK